MELESLKVKIQKLLAKSESAKQIGNAEEAALFAQKVNELLLRHNLDIAELNTESETELSQDGESLTTSKTLGRWTVRLLAVLSEYNFCKVITHDIGKKEMRTTIIGSKENIIAVTYMFEILKLQFELMAKNEYLNYLTTCREKLILPKEEVKDIPLIFYGGKFIPNSEFKETEFGYILRKPQKWHRGVANRSKYYKSFLLGAVVGVSRKLKESHDKLKKNTDDTSVKLTALVLSSGFKLQEYINQHFDINGKDRNTASKVMGEVYRQGISAGQNSSFAKGVSNGDTISTKALN